MPGGGPAKISFNIIEETKIIYEGKRGSDGGMGPQYSMVRFAINQPERSIHGDARTSRVRLMKLSTVSRANISSKIRYEVPRNCAAL